MNNCSTNCSIIGIFDLYHLSRPFHSNDTVSLFSSLFIRKFFSLLHCFIRIFCRSNSCNWNWLSAFLDYTVLNSGWQETTCYWTAAGISRIYSGFWVFWHAPISKIRNIVAFRVLLENRPGVWAWFKPKPADVSTVLNGAPQITTVCNRRTRDTLSLTHTK